MLRLSYFIATVTSFKKRLRIMVINSQVNVSTWWFSLNSLRNCHKILTVNVSTSCCFFWKYARRKSIYYAPEVY